MSDPDARDEAKFQTSIRTSVNARRNKQLAREQARLKNQRVRTHEELDPDLKQAIINSLTPPAVEQNGTEWNIKRLPDSPILPNASGDQLTPQQRVAIGHLIGGASISATAEAVGVSRTTVFRWRQNPTFARVLDQKSGEALEAVATRSRNLLLRATRELENEFDVRRCFSSALRLVNSARLWAMANAAPKIEPASEDDDTTEVPAASVSQDGGDVAAAS